MSDSNIVEYDHSRKFRLTLSDLAKVFNLPVPTVRNYIVKGLPHQKRGELVYFDLRESVQWYREYSAKQIKEYKAGRAASQNFLRELVDGQDLIAKLEDIEHEKQMIYDEIIELGDRFEGSNQHLLNAKGDISPGKMEIEAALNANREKILNARMKVLESRRVGLESLLRKKLPDLKSVEVGRPGEGDSAIDEAFAMFAEAAASES
jgi:hypothetical protein